MKKIDLREEEMVEVELRWVVEVVEAASRLERRSRRQEVQNAVKFSSGWRSQVSERRCAEG